MDVDNDPNAPDRTNGDFFCRLCLASMNSETMWSSHIAGKRHIKNVQKYPNGMPKRRFSDDEDSYDRPPPKHERLNSDYDWDDDYYEDGFYNKRPPADYIPVIKSNIVFDYGHVKKLEPDDPPPIPPPPLPLAMSKLAPVLLEPKKEEIIPASVKLDEILNDIMTDATKESQSHDDFFEKINQREFAKDIANEMAKKRVFSNKAAEKEPEEQSSSSVYEKSDKRKSSLDIFDILHKHNEKKLFKKINEDDSETKDSPLKKSSHSRNSSQEKSSHARNSSQEKSPHNKNSSQKSSHSKNSSQKSSHSKNSSQKSSHSRNSSPETSLRRRKKSDLNNFDPDKLTPDMLDDLLSVHLKAKVTNSNKTLESKKHSVEEIVKKLDDPEVLAEKLNALPTMKILEIFHEKLKNLNLKDSEELKMVIKILAAAQELVCKKLPPNLQAVLNAKLSKSYVKNSEVPPHNASKSENTTLTSVTLSSKSTTVSQNYPSVAPQPQRAIPTVPVAASLQTLISQSPALPPGSIAELVKSTAPSQNHTVPSQSVASLLSRFNFPGMPTFPTGLPMPTASVNPIQSATNQTSMAGRTPNASANQAAWQNYQMCNYYQMMQHVHANRQVTPSNVNSVPSTSQLSVSKQTEQSNNKSSEQSSKSSEQSKDKSSDYSKGRSSQYSKDKSSEYSKIRSSEYSKDKSSEYSNSKYSDDSKNKYSNYSNSKLSEHSISKKPELLGSNQSQNSKSSQPNHLPAALNAHSLQASKELLETLKKLQELSEEYKNSPSAKKTKNN